jgi:O-antigen/teichoic acid export membrane protein
MTSTGSRTTRFLHNVAWSWMGVAVNILLGIFLSPILVRRLGVAQYGVWVLLFSTMDYLRLLDFGFRAAVVNRCARYQARRDWIGVNETINTAILYFLIISLVCCLMAFAGRNAAMDVFKIEPALRHDARILLLIIAVSISARLVFCPVPGALEAFQRFDAINRAYIGSLTVRAVGSLALLLSGHGLIALGYLVLAVQIGEDVWNFVSLKRHFPALRLSPRFMRAEAFRSMFSYGKHSSVMAAANLVSIQSPATVLGYLSGPTQVAYFALPWRLLMYTTEAFAKVGQITSSVTAELDARQDAQNVCNIAIVTNRHCLALFMPAAIFLIFYAQPLLSVWVSPEMGRASGPLLPVLVVPFLLAGAGQFNSGAVLIGQGRHGLYARGIVLEVIGTIAALFLVVPRYGAFGAAVVVSVALTAVRGVYLAVIMCRVNALSIRGYVDAIYTRALLAGGPALALAAALRATVLPGRNWFELLTAAGLVALAYFVVAFFVVIEPGLRGRVLDRLPSAARMLRHATRRRGGTAAPPSSTQII